MPVIYSSLLTQEFNLLIIELGKYLTSIVKEILPVVNGIGIFRGRASTASVYTLAKSLRLGKSQTLKVPKEKVGGNERRKTQYLCRRGRRLPYLRTIVAGASADNGAP